VERITLYKFRQKQVKTESVLNIVGGPAVPRKSAQKPSKTPLVGIIMGSQSDWTTMEHSATILKTFGIAFETAITSAHRTPRRLYEYASTAAERGLQVIIAGAGGAAHLPGMAAAMTILPVFGVPVRSKSLDGLDSLLSIAQMPAGIPVGTLAIGDAGAKNAALLAVAVLALQDKKLAQKLELWRDAQTAAVAVRPKKARK
jgi:5-(carboxyamino)imidazole ribonucleotide mutase